MGTDVKTQVHLRWMIRRDMPSVLSVEEACFAWPWDEEHFISQLRQRNCIAMVAEVNDEVVGYMVYELFRVQITLLNLAVNPKFQRQGIGKQLIERLIDKLSYERRSMIDLVVAENNLDALAFFKSLNFRAIEVIPKAFEDTELDGYLMIHRYKWKGGDGK